jgi:hypothetical protein
VHPDINVTASHKTEMKRFMHGLLGKTPKCRVGGRGEQRDRESESWRLTL